MSSEAAWIILILWLVIPTLHVIGSPNGGAWRPPKDSKCPFGPRVGWLVIVLLFGFFGWLMFLRSRYLHKNHQV